MTVRFAPTLALLALRVCALESLGLSGRVLKYLATAEWQEANPHYRDDIRIAWIVTLEAIRGNLQSHIDATYRVLGCHPDEVLPRLTERREAMLGDQYTEFFPDAKAPKKPSASVANSGKPQNARVKASSPSGY